MGLCMFSMRYHVLGIIARQELCFGIFLVSLSNSTLNSRLRMDTCAGSLHPLISNAGTPDRTFGAFCWRSCDVRIHFFTMIIVTKRPPVMLYGLAHPIYDLRHNSIPSFPAVFSPLMPPALGC